MSRFAEDTIAVINVHGSLFCANCYDQHHFDQEVKEIKRADLAQMIGPEAGHHTEECDDCGRVWANPAKLPEGTAMCPRWIYRHEMAPLTEAEKQEADCFFMDGGLNGEWFIIPYKHRKEWYTWINSQNADKIYTPPAYCTEAADLSDVIFHEYKIDSH